MGFTVNGLWHATHPRGRCTIGAPSTWLLLQSSLEPGVDTGAVMGDCPLFSLDEATGTLPAWSVGKAPAHKPLVEQTAQFFSTLRTRA